MDSRLYELANRQADVVATWQLVAAGWSRKKVKHHAREWRRIHPGVYVLTSSRLTRHQLWFAAALTRPDTVLGVGSAGAAYGFYRFERGYEVVIRPGQGGRRRHGGVLVMRSKTLQGDITRFEGIPITTAARTLIDLAAGLTDDQLGRAFREAIRLKRTTAHKVLEALERHAGRPGTAELRAPAVRYSRIPYSRTRSDAEGLALETLHDAQIELPQVNVEVAGREADLVFAAQKRIIEIDGPQYHQFKDEDALKEQAWRDAGYEVERIPSDAVYDAPDTLRALVHRRL